MAVKGPYNTAALQAGIGDSARKAELLVWEAVVDHSVAANQMAVNDTMPLFKVPAGILVVGASVETLVVEGAAASVDLGITGGDVDKYIDGATVNSLGTVVAGDAGTAEPSSMETSGFITTAEELVSVLALGATIDAAKVRYKVIGFDVRDQLADDSSL